MGNVVFRDDPQTKGEKGETFLPAEQNLNLSVWFSDPGESAGSGTFTSQLLLIIIINFVCTAPFIPEMQLKVLHMKTDRMRIKK